MSSYIAKNEPSGPSTRKTFSLLLLPLLAYLSIFGSSCHEPVTTPKIQYSYKQPRYDLAQIYPIADTIHFQLDENTYNVIKTLNQFTSANKEYISFFEDRSASINIYEFQSRRLVKRILLSKFLGDQKLYKTTVHCKNFDSIFVTNKDKVYLLDSAGKTKFSIKFLENTRTAYATFENAYPPIFHDNVLFTGVRPYVEDDSYKALRKWKNLYGFDLTNKTAQLHYQLPEIYHKNLYGYQFLDYGYCYNNRGNFVFSFPADTNIYETNLDELHLAYSGKSQHQITPVVPLTNEQVKDSDTSYKKYITQDSYGPIFFNNYHKRYLRVMKRKISEEVYEAKERKRQYNFIIFDEQLQIIGESPIPENISYGSLMFTPSGNIYARINAQDENALHFIRLVFKEKEIDSPRLAEVKLNSDN